MSSYIESALRRILTTWIQFWYLDKTFLTILIDNQLKTKQILIEEVVFYWDAYINEDQFLWQQEIDLDDSSQGFIDYDNDIIFEEDKTEEVSIEEQTLRNIFIRIFNSNNLKNVQQMYDSIALKWSKTKLYRYINNTY